MITEKSTAFHALGLPEKGLPLVSMNTKGIRQVHSARLQKRLMHFLLTTLR